MDINIQNTLLVIILIYLEMHQNTLIIIAGIFILTTEIDQKFRRLRTEFCDCLVDAIRTSLSESVTANAIKLTKRIEIL